MRAPLALALVAAMATSGRAEDLAAHAERLCKSSIIVDTHEDVPWELREKWADLAVAGATKHVDIPRLQKGQRRRRLLRAVHAGHAAPTRGRPRTSPSSCRISSTASSPRIRAELAAATSVAEIRAAHKSGRIAILKGIEGGHAIEDSLALLRVLLRASACAT